MTNRIVDHSGEHRDVHKFVFGKTVRLYLTWSDDKSFWVVSSFGGTPPGNWHFNYNFEEWDEANDAFNALCDKHAEDLLAGALKL